MPLAGAPGYDRFLAEFLISHDVTVDDSEAFEITLQGCPDQTVDACSDDLPIIPQDAVWYMDHNGDVAMVMSHGDGCDVMV